MGSRFPMIRFLCSEINLKIEQSSFSDLAIEIIYPPPQVDHKIPWTIFFSWFHEVPTLAENYAKKNRNHFFIAVLLTTLLYSRWMTSNFSFSICDRNLKFFGACNTPLKIYISRAFPTVQYKPQIPKILVGKPKKQISSRLAIAEQAGRKNRNGKAIAVLFCNVFF